MKLSAEQLATLSKMVRERKEQTQELFDRSQDTEWVLPELTKLEQLQQTLEDMLLAE